MSDVRYKLNEDGDLIDDGDGRYPLFAEWIERLDEDTITDVGALDY